MFSGKIYPLDRVVKPRERDAQNPPAGRYKIEHIKAVRDKLKCRRAALRVIPAVDLLQRPLFEYRVNGRYFLKYEDEFKAGDNLNGGMLRAVRTLSGGETFLVSLSLALALSGAICAKSLRPIEFFFLDEGFGTLDEKLVDTVMDVLEKLRSKHFSIGLISHVEELKHRIDNKILVSGATDRCGSSLRIEAY